MRFTTLFQTLRLDAPYPGILDGSFTKNRSASAGLATSVPFANGPSVPDAGETMTRRFGSVLQFVRRRPWLHGALWGATLATIFGVAAFLLRSRLDDPLLRVRLPYRTHEARVVGFGHAPLRSHRALQDSKTAEVWAALTRLEADVARERTPAALHRLAKGELAAGSAARALVLLREVHAARPDDAAILSDLAAAELATGRIADAAEHSAMALERDPQLAEAAFTSAMALEQHANRPAAIRAWRLSLVIDPSSPWAIEARTRLAALEEPRLTWAEERGALVAGADRETIRRLVVKYPWHARLRILNILMPQWARSGDAGVFTLMEAMAEERAASDPYLRDVVVHAGRHRPVMAPLILAYRTALDGYDAEDFAQAAALFASVEEDARAAGSPLWMSAAMFAAACEEPAGRPADALARVARVEAWLRAREVPYPSMLSDAIWTRGLLQARRGFPALAHAAFVEARTAAQRSGEIEQETAAQHLVAAMLEISGDASAEKVRIDALRASEAIRADRDRLFGAFADAAIGALRAGRPRVARALAYAQAAVADEQFETRVRNAGAIADAAARAQALSGAREEHDRWRADADVRRALALLEIGALDAAAQSVKSARARAMAVSTPGYRDRILGDVDFAAGVIAQRRGRPREAIDAFGWAIANWERQGWRLLTASAYLARAESRRAAGDRRGAESDYRAGIEDVEAQRAGFEPELRIAYFERSEQHFERLIDLLVE